jgi:hypothetical protein
MRYVNEGDHQERGEEEGIDHRLDRISKVVKNKEVTDCMDRFNEGILFGDGGMACAATSTKVQEPDQRNVVVKPNGALARRAMRGRENHRFSPWKTINTDVNKASNDKPKNENDNRKGHRQTNRSRMSNALQSSIKGRGSHLSRSGKIMICCFEIYRVE